MTPTCLRCGSELVKEEYGWCERCDPDGGVIAIAVGTRRVIPSNVRTRCGGCGELAVCQPCQVCRRGVCSECYRTRECCSEVP